MDTSPIRHDGQLSSEQSVTWTAPDGATISGEIRTPLRTTSAADYTVINVHGITGNHNEVVHFLAARHFAGLGWAHVRFDLYGDSDGARRLVDVAISQHAADLDTVIADMRRRLPDNKLAVIATAWGCRQRCLCPKRLTRS